MWRFNPFKPKEQTGLEGRTIDIGNLKVQVCNVIAEGGFSCVYLARDVLYGLNQYALKHIICNDEESLALVMKEISVMKSLKGHPNVVTLHAHTLFDMGRTKETILVLEYCEKSLVNVLESRGAAFFEEKKILTIFRDVCNAVFAMHCQSPPIAHRDLKAENLLLGSDGLWKLCDFGSTSTNHKRFEKPEEMGIEEDNIRKHTMPAYRAPEMWDLFRRELINEKVDIWALGYFKSAFDGDSKLQILNGNYCIPDLPKYSTSITDLIQDMLQSSPDARPDITQVWFRVNNLLPEGLQKPLPDRPPEMQLHFSDAHEGIYNPGSKSTPIPRRSPPPTPSGAEPARHVSPPSQNSRTSESGAPLGAFWTTQHVHDSVGSKEKTRPKFDEGLTSNSSSRHDGSRSDRTPVSLKSSPLKGETLRFHPVQKNVQAKPADGPSKDFEIKNFQGDLDHGIERPKAPKTDSKPASQGDAFDGFVAEFGNNKRSPKWNIGKSEKEDLLEAEIEKIKQQLEKVNTEKAEMTSKYEKLSAICRSQRQEIQELKQSLAARTPSPGRDASRNQASPSSQPASILLQREKIEGTVWELQQGFDQSTQIPEPKPWQAFTDDRKSETASINNVPRSVRTGNDHQNRQAAEVNSRSSTWGFVSDNFRAAPAATSQMPSKHGGKFGKSQRFGESKNTESTPSSQPSGWAGF